MRVLYPKGKVLRKFDATRYGLAADFQIARTFLNDFPEFQHFLTAISTNNAASHTDLGLFTVPKMSQSGNAVNINKQRSSEKGSI
jgi:hypothetical protein